jgi:peptide-methionine (R)-S-oxide reductase
MIRRQFIAALGALFVAHRAAAQKPKADAEPKIEKLRLSEDEWRKRLTPEQFAVLRQEATERPGSSPLNNEKRKGTYACAGCDLGLFSSETKYESGTGWPSFYAPIPGRLGTKTDFKILYPRTEYHCIRCDGHQGHVFDDGPKPTGKRYCNNGVALKFVAG